jgi:phosphatidylcholine synthase
MAAGLSFDRAMGDEGQAVNPVRRAAAWAVHAFTASGAVLALLALFAIQGHRWTEAMLWLLAALVVDGVDGSLARAAHVKTLASRIDGDVLDLVIDYLNYVFVPTIFLLEARLLPADLAFPLAALIQISSLYVFARRDMKTQDSYFRGFPALWNVVALYLFAAGVGANIGAAVVVAFVALTFAPIHFVHPFRVRDYGAWPAVLSCLWTGATLGLLLSPGAALRPMLLGISSVAGLAIVALGLWRTARGSRAPASG